MAINFVNPEEIQSLAELTITSSIQENIAPKYHQEVISYRRDFFLNKEENIKISFSLDDLLNDSELSQAFKDFLSRISENRTDLLFRIWEIIDDGTKFNFINFLYAYNYCYKKSARSAGEAVTILFVSQFFNDWEKIRILLSEDSPDKEKISKSFMNLIVIADDRFKKNSPR